MDEEYLLERMRASLEMANRAESSIARLIHFELAGRYSLAAAQAASDHAHPDTAPPRSVVSAFGGGDRAVLLDWPLARGGTRVGAPSTRGAVGHENSAGRAMFLVSNSKPSGEVASTAPQFG